MSFCFVAQQKIMKLNFRQAVLADVDRVWQILQQGIQKRKAEGSQQWQDGYPNLQVLLADIAKASGLVMEINGEGIVGYCALMVNDEPQYAHIEGQWLSDGDFVVFHRLVIAQEHLGKGLAKAFFAEIENFARTRQIQSVRADTNFDNLEMLQLFARCGYSYCGEVWFRGTPRKAFEKLL